MEISNSEENCRFSRSHFMLKFNKLKSDVQDIGKLTKQVAEDDPRRVVHCFKVGLAIALVSFFYYFDPLYEGFGVNAMWAVLTVVVIFEFSVGATLGKGLNRVVATILGGITAVGAHKLFSLAGETLEPLFLGLSVFLIAALTTFARFFPKMKARYDYGLMIFILTFSLVCVSGYRDDEIIDIATRRTTTILIGCATAVFVCVLICPVFAGTDLHNLISTNLLILADFFQEFGAEYFKNSRDKISSKDSNKVTFDRLKKVLDSKSNVDSLLNLARWEPRHGKFKYRHPWTQYQKIADVARRCSCRAEVLHDFLISQMQVGNQVKSELGEPFMLMSIESGKALNELSMAITKMVQPWKAKNHVEKARQAAQNLKTLLLISNAWENHNSISYVTPAVAIATLLEDVVACTVEIADEVRELASLAKFKEVTDDEVEVEVETDPSKLVKQSSITETTLKNHVIRINDGSSQSSSPRFSSVISQDPPSLAMAQQNTE